MEGSSPRAACQPLLALWTTACPSLPLPHACCPLGLSFISPLAILGLGIFLHAPSSSLFPLAMSPFRKLSS